MQRGAVPPLINMLKTNDRALREMAAFALGRLAQNADNQAGIFAMGVLQPLLDLLTSKVKNLEHNAAFTLYGLADNPDNVPEIVKRVRPSLCGCEMVLRVWPGAERRACAGRVRAATSGGLPGRPAHQGLHR